MLSGMDVARLNFSHGDHAGHKQCLDLIRGLNNKYRRHIRILQDLEGYRIRTGRFKDKMKLYFVTGNIGKYQEVKEIMKDYGINVSHIKIDKPEKDNPDIKEIDNDIFETSIDLDFSKYDCDPIFEIKAFWEKLPELYLLDFQHTFDIPRFQKAFEDLRKEVAEEMAKTEALSSRGFFQKAKEIYYG